MGVSSKKGNSYKVQFLIYSSKTCCFWFYESKDERSEIIIKLKYMFEDLFNFGIDLVSLPFQATAEVFGLDDISDSIEEVKNDFKL